MEEVEKVSREKGLKLVGAYLVGSRAREDYLEDSDIDIVLVIDEIQGLNRLQRISMFLEALKPGMDLFIYIPEKWRGESPWIKEFKRGKADKRSPESFVSSGVWSQSLGSYDLLRSKVLSEK